MARHLLDTDVLIWVLKGKMEAVDFVRDLLRQEVPSISSLSIYEVWAAAKASEETAIAAFLSSFTIIQVNDGVARQGAHYYKQFRSKGLALSSTDALIAATARVHQFILVTQNLRNFPMTDIEKRSL